MEQTILNAVNNLHRNQDQRAARVDSLFMDQEGPCIMDCGTPITPEDENKKDIMINWTLLVIVMVLSHVNQVEGRNQNLHSSLVQNITQILHKNDCCICTPMPKYSSHGISLIPS